MGLVTTGGLTYTSRMDENGVSMKVEFTVRAGPDYNADQLRDLVMKAMETINTRDNHLREKLSKELSEIIEGCKHEELAAGN